MEDLTLTKLQKNEIFELVINDSLPIANFHWIEENDRWDVDEFSYSVLRFQDNYYFSFFRAYCDGNFKIFYQPGYYYHHVREDIKGWENVKRNFITWLSILKRHLEEPDLWAELARYKPTNELLLPTNNVTYFTYEQVENLKITLEKIKEEIIAEFQPNVEQILKLTEQIEYLVDEAKHQKIRDWQNICLGSFMSLALSLCITPDKIDTYWKIISTGFGVIRHYLGM
jgi:hypothetical protein